MDSNRPGVTGFVHIGLVVDYALDVAGLHRLHLQVLAFNPRAQRAYEKCGFVREGVHRDALHREGAWHDTISMTILATDPRPAAAVTGAPRPASW